MCDMLNMSGIGNLDSGYYRPLHVSSLRAVAAPLFRYVTVVLSPSTPLDMEVYVMAITFAGSGRALHRALTITHKSRDTTGRNILGGAHLRFDSHGLVAIATDRFVVTYTRLPVSFPVGEDQRFSFVLSRDDFDELFSIVKANRKDSVAFSYDYEMATMTVSAGGTLTTFTSFPEQFVNLDRIVVFQDAQRDRCVEPEGYTIDTAVLGRFKERDRVITLLPGQDGRRPVHFVLEDRRLTPRTDDGCEFEAVGVIMPARPKALNHQRGPGTTIGRAFSGFGL